LQLNNTKLYIYTRKNKEKNYIIFHLILIKTALLLLALGIFLLLRFLLKVVSSKHLL